MASPKGVQSKSSSHMTRSAARRDPMRINRHNYMQEYGDNKTLGLNPFKIQVKRNSIKSRSLSKNSKARPRSYRINYKKQLNCNEESADTSFVNNISIVQTSNVDDSFCSLRGGQNASKLSKKRKSLKCRVPWSTKNFVRRKMRKLKFQNDVKFHKPGLLKLKLQNSSNTNVTLDSSQNGKLEVDY